MQLYYYVDPQGNFGDDLNPLVWRHFIPELLDDDPDTLFLGIGTLLGHRLPPSARKVVFGSGAGYGPTPAPDGTWTIHCVRGPLTAQAVGLPPTRAITDPAILLAAMPQPQAAPATGISFMPHHDSKRHGDWAAVCALAGIRYLDPADDVQATLDAIRTSRLVIAEAMHAAIVADAFRVPWVPVVCYGHILAFKWEDWCQSLALPYRPIRLPAIHDIPARLPAAAWIKGETKRALRGLGLMPRRWSLPVPRRTSARDAEHAATRLCAIAAQGPQYLSTQAAHDTALQRLQESLLQLKRGRRPG